MTLKKAFFDRVANHELLEMWCKKEETDVRNVFDAEYYRQYLIWGGYLVLLSAYTFVVTAGTEKYAFVEILFLIIGIVLFFLSFLWSLPVVTSTKLLFPDRHFLADCKKLWWFLEGGKGSIPSSNMSYLKAFVDQTLVSKAEEILRLFGPARSLFPGAGDRGFAQIRSDIDKTEKASREFKDFYEVAVRFDLTEKTIEQYRGEGLKRFERTPLTLTATG